MEETFVIYLRQNNIIDPKAKCKMLIEESMEINDDLEDQPEEYGNESIKIQKVFESFVKKAEKLLPLNNVDVYIGWWTSQGTFDIPLSFFDFITTHKLKVQFSLND